MSEDTESTTPVATSESQEINSPAATFAEKTFEEAKEEAHKLYAWLGMQAEHIHIFTLHLEHIVEKKIKEIMSDDSKKKSV